MMKPAQIEPWLTTEEMLVWVREAPTKNSYQHRLAVWMTHGGKLHAQQVANFLAVSVPSVWRWISQYNKQGPQGIEGPGSGGRRWGFVSLAEEQSILQSFRARAVKGELVNVKKMHQEICKQIGREVSIAYVYRLLYRHGWRKIGPRPRHPQANPEEQVAFKKKSR
jgi:transposase